MVMLSAPGPSAAQDATAVALLRLLKLYRRERDLAARREIAGTIRTLAARLAELPDAGHVPGTPRWPVPPAPAGAEPNPPPRIP